jgi:hypothetical protein
MPVEHGAVLSPLVQEDTMHVTVNPLTAARYPRPRTTGRTPAPPAAHATGARATVTLALGAYGLIDVVEDLGSPWTGLVQTLVLAALALAFFIAAQRSHDHRVGWLLSGSAALGLAITAFSNVIDATATRVLPLAGLLVCIAILPFVIPGAQQRPHR